MSKQPLGKTLLRNVIRHTDAHNKIQEEMEMWKLRSWEVQTSHRKHLPDTDCVRGRMHCDREPDQTRDLSRGQEGVSEHDDRDARYWTRKLYEFEAGDPDRWGHSGYKELYPEEFESDSEKKRTTKKLGRHKLKKSKSGTEAGLSKHSKKSSRKKKKKKKKKDDGKKHKEAKCSSSDDSSDSSSTGEDKQRRKRTERQRKDRKSEKTKGRDDSSSEESDDGERKRRTRSHKKRKRDSKDSGLSLNKRRKNWKAAGEQSSDHSSD